MLEILFSVAMVPACTSICFNFCCVSSSSKLNAASLTPFAYIANTDAIVTADGVECMQGSDFILIGFNRLNFEHFDELF